MKPSISGPSARERWRSITARKAAVLDSFRSVLRFIGRPAGIDAFPFRRGYHYAPDYFGRAAYKQTDIRSLPVFGEVAGDVIRAGRTPLYYDRLYTIYQLLVQLRDRRSPAQKVNLAEVGVYKGGTSYFIAAIAGRLGLEVAHHCFDTFEGHSLQDITATVDADHNPAIFSDTSFEDVKKYLSPYGNVFVYKGRFQETCAALDPKEIHFAHIDMDIYEPTLFALNYFNRKLVPGGAMLIDDYGFSTCPGIQKAVEEFRSVEKGYFGMPLLTGQYLLVNTKKEI